MTNSWDGQSFPRKLNEIENYWLDFLLPDSNKFYREYKEKIKNLFVIGYGRNIPLSLILGQKEDQPITDFPSPQILATGIFEYNFGKVEISIYEFFEDQLQLDIFIQSPVDLNFFELDELKKQEIRKATFSNWKPGNPYPYDNSPLREVIIQRDQTSLAISTKHKRIWAYSFSDETIHFIPITNFYQEILKSAQIRDPRIITDINYLYLNLNKFTDEQIINAFINYNKIWRKVSLNLETQEPIKKENLLLKILKRLKWMK